MVNPVTFPGGRALFSTYWFGRPTATIGMVSVCLEQAIETFAHEPNGALILPPDVFFNTHRDLIIRLASKHYLPAIYSTRHYVTSGGLMSYGPDYQVLHRQAAGYIDRLLTGAKPIDLPVQAPTKWEFVLNLKTAKALGLDVPPTVLARADEVIE